MTRTFLVTGAGSGIGRAVAQRLAADGARLLLLGRRRGALEETLELLAQDVDHSTLVADVTRAEDLRGALAEVDLSEGLDGVIVNAGVGGPNRYGPEDRWQEILTTNLTGSYLTAQESLPYLRRSSAPRRHLVFNSSLLGRMGAPLHSAYCASKAGILGLMRSLAVELAPEGILVNAFCPGWVDTDLAHSGLEAIAGVLGQPPETCLAGFLAQVPLQRMSTPGEVAELVAYLVSPHQFGTTGCAIDLNNGSFMTP